MTSSADAPGRPFQLRWIAAAALVVALAGTTAADGGDATGPVPPLRHEGRWLTDARGRVVLLHGVNVVEKRPPFHPAAVGFDADDAAFLASHGLLAVRLGVVFEAIMPSPGVVDTAYVEHLATTVDELAQHGILVLLDLHQDGWGPAVHGNGMPAWATITDGLPNPPDPFPTYYITNPALQRAFENFWENRRGPDGVRLQTHYARVVRTLARRFGDTPYVLGQDPMNEPWPGADWTPCLAGCPELERARLVPFYGRVAPAARAARHGLLFVEPFVLFNFGMAQTALPAMGGPRAAFSFHVYATSADADRAVMQAAVAHGEHTGAALLATEWGATDDVAKISRTAGQFDAELLPWIFWSYLENVVRDPAVPPSGDNLHAGVIDALTRPYPLAINGTPFRVVFDPATRELDCAWSTRRPDGRRAGRELETVIVVPAATYPTGRVVTVDGGTPTSPAGSATLTIRHDDGADAVHVHVAPAS